MRQFFKFVLATVVGLLAFSFLGFVLLAGIIGAAASSSGKARKWPPTRCWSSSSTSRSRSAGATASSAASAGGSATTGLVELKAAIRRAKADDDIKGILLNLDFVQGGMASLEEVRDALLDFKKSGKFVVAYHEMCSEKSYYLSSVANEIYLHPQGTLEFNGLSAEVMFYKRLFDKAGIEPYIFRVGSFKSAVEPFFRENFSDSARYQTVSFLNSINDYMVEQVATAARHRPGPPQGHFRLHAGAQRPRRPAPEAGDQARLL